LSTVSATWIAFAGVVTGHLRAANDPLAARPSEPNGILAGTAAAGAGGVTTEIWPICTTGAPAARTSQAFSAGTRTCVAAC